MFLKSGPARARGLKLPCAPGVLLVNVRARKGPWIETSSWNYLYGESSSGPARARKGPWIETVEELMEAFRLRQGPQGPVD